MNLPLMVIIGFIVFGIICNEYHKETLKRERAHRQRVVHHQLKVFQDRKKLFEMSPRDFEYYVAAFLQLTRKFKTEVTQATKDGGKDIICYDGKTPIYVEVKHWTGKVGRPVIQKLEGAMSGDKINQGYCVTSSFFTKDAIEYAEKTNITLIDGEMLIREMLI